MDLKKVLARCMPVIIQVIFLLHQEGPLRSSIILQKQCTYAVYKYGDGPVLITSSSECTREAFTCGLVLPWFASDISSLVATTRSHCSYVLSAGLLLRPRWWARVGMASGLWSTHISPFKPFLSPLFIKLLGSFLTPFDSSQMYYMWEICAHNTTALKFRTLAIHLLSM